MLRTVKPRTARSKRALDAREPKEVEDPRTAIFVKGTHTGDVLNGVMRELMALKRPHAISFAKKNTVRPFEDAASLEFWAQKNDASMFVVGQSTKKRPNNLVLARTYDGRVLDMCELGVEKFVSMNEFKTPKSTPGHKPLLHFASELFDTHPRLMQVKSLLLDFFNGEALDGIHLAGLEHVISVSLGPTPATLSSAPAPALSDAPPADALPQIHIRTYTVRLLASGTRVPRAALTPMGPSLDLTLRRHQPADAELWRQALKKPKLPQKDAAKGLGKKTKNKEVDEMGDLRGRVHVGRQDLGRVQTRKMKGLKGGAVDDDVEMAEAESGAEATEGEDGAPKKRRRRA